MTEIIIEKNKNKNVATRRFRFSPLDWLCIATGVTVSIMTILTDQSHSLTYIAASIILLNAGILEVILGINGRRSCYIFAAIGAAFSILVAQIDHFYGYLLINAYYVPLSIIGFYTWGKHSDKNKDVIARRLTTKQIIIIGIIFVVSSIGLKLILDSMGSQSTMLDGIATIMIVFASLLGVLRYREQWLAWFVADVLLLIMWIGTGGPAIIATRVFFVLSSIYGYVNWRKLVKGNKRF